MCIVDIYLNLECLLHPVDTYVLVCLSTRLLFVPSDFHLKLNLFLRQ